MGEDQYKVTTVLCFTLCLVVIVQGTTLRDAPADGVPLTTFRMTRITRQSSNNGHNVTVHLTGPDRDLPTAYFFTQWYLPPRHLGNPSNGILQFHMESDSGSIELVHPRGYQGLRIWRLEHAAAEQNLPRLELTLQEGRRLVYQQGHDTDVHARLSVVSNEQSRASDVNMGQNVAVKSTAEDSVVDVRGYYHRLPVFDVLNLTKSNNVISTHLRINTSASNMEGIVQLRAFTAMTCRDACMVGHYYIREEVPLYQAGHTGPFPANFIGYKNEVGLYRPVAVKCYVNERRICMVRCGFMGDHPTPVRFERVSGVDVGHYEQFSLPGRQYHAKGLLTFTNVTTAGEAEYVCSSRSGQNRISHTIRVRAVIPPWRRRGRRNAREATRMQDGTD